MSTPEAVTLQHFIAGRWEEGTGAVMERRNPARPTELVAWGRVTDSDGVDRAIDAARAAARPWRRMPAQERAGYLVRAADALESRRDGLGIELAREEGKTLVEARAEVDRAAQILRFFAADADRQAGAAYASPRRGERILVTRRPIGVVGVVTPFNFPLAIPAWKIAPALVYGNTVVWKPASATPLLAMRLAEAFEVAGLPSGVLNLAIGPGALGERIITHPGVDAVTFTGSTAVGRGLATRLAATGTPFQAEMGGKNSSIVLADADLEHAVDQVVLGAFRSSGQKCTATSRLILDRSIADDVLEMLRARTAELVVGDPLADDTFLGPVVDERSHASIRSAIAEAREYGLTEVFGCDYTEGALAEGTFISPTIFDAGDAADAPVWSTELFGPVLAARRAEDADHAFALANDTEYGLSAALFTRDLGAALDGIDDLHVGMLHVNSESAGSDPHVPFGGTKRSGLGPKEQGTAAREFFTETTTVYLRG